MTYLSKLDSFLLTQTKTYPETETQKLLIPSGCFVLCTYRVVYSVEDVVVIIADILVSISLFTTYRLWILWISYEHFCSFCQHSWLVLLSLKIHFMKLQFWNVVFAVSVEHWVCLNIILFIFSSNLSSKSVGWASVSFQSHGENKTWCIWMRSLIFSILYI